MRTILGASAVAMMLLAGCGSDANDAPAKCDVLVDTLCVRAVACFNDGTTQTECVADAKTGLPCAGADAVGDTYDACISELQASPCSVLTANQTINLPATCRSVILFR